MEENETLLSERQDKILEELCICNGISYEKLKDGSGGNKAVEMLEMFFSGYPEMVGLSYFPNLCTLCLMGQDNLEKIFGLEHLVNLEELWICEANIQKIHGLETCHKLKRLYLYDNTISKIENLSNLSLLEELWLNDNTITCIEGLDGLLNIKNLNLSNNAICQIGNTLEKLLKLEVLHLSGNQIRSFKDLYNLVHLQSLHTLSLKDPVYIANPVALMCNYSTYIFFHLPQLKRLDGYDIDNESFKVLAETTVMKKKMYYNMRVKTLERNLNKLMKQVGEEKQCLQDSPCNRICNLMRTLKSLKCEPEETSEEIIICGQSKTAHDCCETSNITGLSNKQQVEAKMKCIKDRVKDLELICDEIDQCFRESCKQVENISLATIHRLFLELESGGNVRFEDGSPNDIWYTSCYDLVLSRFCASDFKAYSITGIKIHRITRIHNRVLRVAFDEKVSSLVAKKDRYLDMADQKNLVRNSIEYLFTVWNTAVNSKNCSIRPLEEGYQGMQQGYQGIQENVVSQFDGIHLSNSVFDSDATRLEFLTKQRNSKQQGDRCPYRHGQLVIAKVFVGDMKVAEKGERYLASGTKVSETGDLVVFHSLQTTFVGILSDLLHVKTPQTCYSLLKLQVCYSITKEDFPETDSVFIQRYENDTTTYTKVTDISCDCQTKQGDWIVFDGDLVLPEYVVDFEYLTKMKPVSPLICYYGDTTCGIEQSSSDVKSYPDYDILDMEPFVQPKPRLCELTEDLLLMYCSVDSVKNITVLDLHDSGLARLKNINHLANLKKLIVSFNALTKLEDIACMPYLTFLDASFNNVTTLDGIKSCPVLQFVNVSWNQLKHIREEIGFLRKHVTSVTSLDTRHNPWLRADNFRTYTIGRLRTLQELDGEEITEHELALALRQAASSRISSFSILAHSRTDDDVVRSLSLASTASVVLKHSKLKPVVVGNDDINWLKSVTALQLDGQGISKLSNLEQLQHLKWASFNDNNINKIEGLDACSVLEELSISGNCISKIEGLATLSKLRRLNVDDNNLMSLESNVMEHMINLEYLSFENNFVSSIQGLKKCPALREIFAGSNLISNTREIFHLKNLADLDILDLSGNSIVSSNGDYRLFVVYHLTSLKALNAVAVTPAERSTAKETLGGRMTMDFVAERLGHANFTDLQEIDLPHCELRIIDVGNGQVFKHLRSINLEHNNLTSFGGLIHLANLKVLCLNYNKIDCVFAKRKSTSPTSKKVPALVNTSDVTSPQSYTPVLEKLEVLHLGYNGITNLKGLQLSRIPNLKALFLQGNEISKVEGLDGLQELRELVLDQNKIKTLLETSFIGQRKLQELHMEDNRLKDLSHFNPLFSIQRLYLGMNKIQDLSELHKLEQLSNLFEISLVSNPVARRLMHRPILVYRQQNILCIDGIPVTTDERTKAEMYLIEHQLTSVLNPEHTETNFPTVQAKPPAPLKVTTVQLTASLDSGWNIGQRFGHVDYLESISPTQSRYNDRNDVRGKLRASNSYPSQTLSQASSSYDVTALKHGRRQPPTSSMTYSKPQCQVSNSAPYLLRGNPNSTLPPPPPKK